MKRKHREALAVSFFASSIVLLADIFADFLFLIAPTFSPIAVKLIECAFLFLAAIYIFQSKD